MPSGLVPSGTRTGRSPSAGHGLSMTATIAGARRPVQARRAAGPCRLADCGDAAAALNRRERVRGNCTMHSRAVFAALVAALVLGGLRDRRPVEPTRTAGRFPTGPQHRRRRQCAGRRPVARRPPPRNGKPAIEEAVARNASAAMRATGSINIGIAVDGYALAPPGDPGAAAPEIGAGRHGQRLGRCRADAS